MATENTLAQRLFDIAFTRVRSERSQVYKDGVMAALQTMCDPGKPSQSCPFTAGTVEFDAWFAGRDEGLSIWHAYLYDNPQFKRERTQRMNRVSSVGVR